MSRQTKTPEALRTAVRARLADVPGIAQPVVIETMNAYLEAALDAVCNGDALDHLLGDLDGAVPDVVLVPVSATLVAAYLHGAANLHAALVAVSGPVASVETALTKGDDSHA